MLTDIIEWDIVNWSHCLRYWSRFLPKGAYLRCLEVGSRRGGLSLWLSSLGHQVVCTDINDPGDAARRVHKKYPFCLNVTYRALDATNIPFKGTFDVIAFKSILGAIGRNSNYSAEKRAVFQMYQALKPGGLLLFAENLAATPLHQLLRKKLLRWGRSWRYLKLSEVRDLFAEFEILHFQCEGFIGSFGRTERQRKFLGKIDNVLTRAIPNSWKYIVIGVAKKQADSRAG